ncbi:hypothetical protein DYU11_22545 [Fibrisoma montanum]|uniref:Uncharacterized protein n=1 Tax=Fibrisoma montanum TaxID=2305895 RepID=A0A418M1X6_9BACT|nr:hypothetical protein [Fibrisoma montanum]RIV19711.1 hypothetical protein DYU11_22545 [Fibrisoma montanum]
MNNAMLIPFVLVSLSSLFQYGMLLLAPPDKGRVWKIAIYVGMLGCGLSAFGFIAPRLNPWPWETFATFIGAMLGGVVLSYYQRPVPDTYSAEQRALELERRQDALLDLGRGLAFMLILTTVVAYLQGQQQGQRVQVGFSEALQAMADEVKSLRNEVKSLRHEMNDLKQHERVTDSTVIRNQRTGLSNQEEIKKDLKRRRR